MENRSGWEIIISQVDTILLFLQRPIVVRQLTTFLLLLFVAWLCSTMVWHLVRKRISAWAENSLSPRRKYGQYLVVFIRETAFPLFAILGLSLLSQRLGARGADNQLLLFWSLFLWISLIYRLTIALLYIMLGERMKQYHTYFAAPLFSLSLMIIVLGTTINIGALERIELWTLFEHPLMLGEVLTSIAVLYFLFSGAWVVQDLIEHVVLPRTNADSGVVHAGLTIGRYVVIGVGLLIVFDILGLNASSLAWIGGGLSIGIGFGLQQIVGNFVSGIILLFERSLKPGDVIRVEGDIGTVEALNIRSTTIRTPNNVQVIVPNETFLTNSVTNYTHDSPIVRILIPVGASYDSDPREIFQALLEAAQQYEGILKEPAPTIFFSGFGDHSIDFKLVVWVNKPGKVSPIESELRLLIWDEFAKRNIEMPFPQRDLHIRSGIPWEKFGDW